MGSTRGPPPLNSLVLLLDGVGQVKCKDHAEQLKKSDTNTKSTNSPNVTFDLNTENIQAALGVDLHCGLIWRESENPQSTSGDIRQAAGVRNIRSSRECYIGPVLVLLSTTTVQLMLYSIPSMSNSIISSLIIVLHPLLHIVIQKIIDLAF